MNRRDLVAAVVAAAAQCGAARARSDATIGMLVPVDADDFVRIFKDGMAENGLRQGETARYETRVATESSAGAFAAELVRLNVDVLVAHQTPLVRAAKAATVNIPIVAVAGDLVASGFVDSLTNPGGNVTGVSGLTSEMGAKCVELLRELLPAAGVLAAMGNEADPFMATFLAAVETVARRQRFDLHLIRVAQDVEAGLAAVARTGTKALVVQPSLPRRRVFEWARLNGVATACPFHRSERAGSLIAYSADPADLYRTAALITGKVLNGAPAGTIPVALPVTFRLALNLKTGAALGLTIPPVLLARADEVVE